MLTLDQQDQVRDLMVLNMDAVETATQLAELVADLLNIQHELDDPDSEIWDLALDYIEEP